LLASPVLDLVYTTGLVRVNTDIPLQDRYPQGAVTRGLYRYLATNPKLLDENNCHKSRTPNDEPSDPKILHQGGPAIPILEANSRCINIHAYNTARYNKSISEIELYRGPVEIWEAKRGNAHTLKNYLRAINPLTQLMQKYFQYLLPDFYTKYKKVYNQLLVTYLTEDKKEWFGIWTSRETVLSTFTKVHVGLHDIPLGFCAIIPLGNFTDGHIYLPSLGIKLTLQPGRVFLYKYLYNYDKTNILIRYYCFPTLVFTATLCWKMDWKPL